MLCSVINRNINDEKSFFLFPVLKLTLPCLKYRMIIRETCISYSKSFPIPQNCYSPATDTQANYFRVPPATCPRNQSFAFHPWIINERRGVHPKARAFKNNLARAWIDRTWARDTAVKSGTTSVVPRLAGSFSLFPDLRSMISAAPVLFHPREGKVRSWGALLPGHGWRTSVSHRRLSSLSTERLIYANAWPALCRESNIAGNVNAAGIRVAIF